MVGVAVIEHETRILFLAHIAEGDSLGATCEALEVDAREVLDLLMTDAGFARAVLAAQGERAKRNWKGLFMDLHRLAMSADEAAGAAGSAYSTLDDIERLLAAHEDRP
jgi:hypothetical protein